MSPMPFEVGAYGYDRT